MKRNVGYSFVSRVLTLSHEDYHYKNINTIYNILRKNNYPKEEINKFIKKYNSIRNRRSRISEENVNMDENMYHSITYVEGLTEKMSRELKKMDNSIRIAHKVGNTLQNVFSKTKDKIVTYDRSNVIYKVECEGCDNVYIGQTSKKLDTRMTQHEKDVERQAGWLERLSQAPIRLKDEEIINKVTQNQTALVKHAITMNHTFNFNDAKILDEHSHKRKREFIESAQIHLHPNTVNYKQDLMKIYPSYYNIVNYYSKNNDKSPNKKKKMINQRTLSDN